MNAIDHIIVVCEDSRAEGGHSGAQPPWPTSIGRRISVVGTINSERRTIGCCMRSDKWNRILAEVVRGVRSA